MTSVHGIALALVWAAVVIAVGVIMWAVADLVRDPGRRKRRG